MVHRVRLPLAIFAAILALLAIESLSSCHASANDRPAHGVSVKGWELYSWPGDRPGVWQFALLEGTNHVKTSKEIRSSREQVRGLNALLRELDRLPPGEFVYWCAPRAPGQPATTNDFPLPPREYLEAATERAEQRRLVLALP